MSTVIVFAGGEVPPREVVTDLPTAELVVAADGGLKVAEVLGISVDVLVGDLDSVDPELPGHLIVERHPEDKDATDLELAFELIARDWPERVVVVGGAGGRADHELATASLICSSRWAPIEEIDWVTGRARSHVVRGHRQIHGDVGTLISLIPYGGDATDVRTKGLRWELDGDTLSTGSTRGVSNLMISPVVDVRIGSGVLLAVLPSHPSSPAGMEGSRPS
jgi:thiamine pyrophosphokinase